MAQIHGNVRVSTDEADEAVGPQLVPVVAAPLVLVVGAALVLRQRKYSLPLSSLLPNRSLSPTREPPLPVQTTSRGRSTGPILATARPIPASVMIGHHMVTRSSTAAQTNASVAADHARRARGLLETQYSLPSAKTRTQPPPTRGGKAAPGGMSRADSLLDRALQLAEELKNKNLAPGSKGAKPQPVSRPQAQGRGNLEPPPNRPRRSQSPRPPPGRTFESSLATPDDFMAAFMSRMGGKSSSVPQQAVKQEVTTIRESKAEGTNRHPTKVMQGTTPTKNASTIDPQTQDALDVPRVHMPVAPLVPPQPTIVFSAKRSQREASVEGTEVKQSSEASILASKPNTSFWNSEETFEPESDKPDMDLIDFDHEEVQTEFARPTTGTWMQQDHGLLDLDNDVIHTQPILPKSSATWQTDIATQGTPIVMDEPVNLSDFEDEIRTLSSVLSHLTLSDDKDVSNLKLGLQKTMARLTREAATQKRARDVAASAQSSRLDAPAGSDALRIARQPPKSANSQDEDMVTGKDIFAPKALPSGSRLPQAAEFTFSVSEGPKPKSFGDFATKEKSKTQQRRQDKTSQDKATNLDDLKSFSRNFIFDKPVPADLTLLLGKDKAKEQPVVPQQVQGAGLGVHVGSTTSHYKPPGVETILDGDEPAKASTSAPQESFKEPTQLKAKAQVLQPPPPNVHIPAAQPRLPQTQGPAIASSSNPEPLPPGRNLYYKAKFSPLPAHDPRKVPYTFDSGLKLRPVIIGDHLLPGQGGVVESRSAHREPSPVSAQQESSPTPAPRQFKQTRQKFETKFESSNPERSSTPIFGDGLLPGQRTRAQRPTNVFGDSSYLGAQVASNSSDLVDRDRAERFQAPSQEPIVNASSSSLFGERLLPGRCSSAVSVHATGSSTNIQHPASLSTRPTPSKNSPDAPPLAYGEPIEKKKAMLSTASQKGALKYSASQLMNIQAPVTLDSDRVSAIRRIISASMDKTHGTKSKETFPDVGQSSPRSGLKAVPVTTPVSTARTSAPVQSRIPSVDVPNIPDNAMTRQYNALGRGTSRAANDTTTTIPRGDSDKESATRLGMHASTDAGTNRRPAIFDSIYAAATSAESNRSQAVGTEHNQRASATQAAPARRTSTFAAERERYDAARVAAHRQRPTRENAPADAGPAPPADNPFASFSRPAAAPTASSESFRTQSANTAALSFRQANEKESKPKTNAKKEVDGVSQSIHASRWAGSFTEPNTTRRTFNNDGFMGRR
jgi:hypothetical protein